MRGQHSNAHRTAASSVVLGVVLVTMTAYAWQKPETITADASVKSAAGVKATAPVVVTITRYASDADRDALMAALKQSGTDGARQLLAKRDGIGSVQVGGRQTAIKYAYARSTGAGQLITIVTGEPIVFIGAGLPDAKPKAGYDLGLLLLDTAASGPGRGELIPATKIRVNAEGAIVTEDYSGEVVGLSNVVRR
jgi:hypothetical protein